MKHALFAAYLVASIAAIPTLAFPQSSGSPTFNSVTINTDPSTSTQAARKGYVDTQVGNEVSRAEAAESAATSASNLTSGTIAGARLPVPTATVLGGVKSLTGSNQVITGIDTTGTPTSTPFIGTAAGTARDAAAAITAETAAQTTASAAAATANSAVQAAGGDISATTSLSTGSLFPRSPAVRGADSVNVMDYGAYGDGAAHRLNTLFTTLVAAQVKYPAAYSLAETADQAAFDSAFAAIVASPIASTGPTGPQYKDLFVPTGGYDIDYITVPPRVHLRGAGRQQTFIQGIVSGGVVTSGLAVSSVVQSGVTVTVTATAALGLNVGQGYFVTLTGMVPTGYNGTYNAYVTGANTFTFTLQTSPGAVTTLGTYGIDQAAITLGLNPAFAGESTNQEKIFDNATVSDLTVAGGSFGYPASIALMDATDSSTYHANSGYINTVSALGGTVATVYIGIDRPAGYVHDLNERGGLATGDGIMLYSDDWRFDTGELSDNPGGAGFDCVHGGYIDIYGFNDYSNINGLVKQAGCDGYIDWNAGSIDTNTGAAAVLASTGSTDAQDGYVKFNGTRFETNSTAASGPIIITGAEGLHLTNVNFTNNGVSPVPTYLIQNTGPVHISSTNIGDSSQYTIAAVSNPALADNWEYNVAVPASMGTNIVGSNLALQAGSGTGTAVGGSLTFSTCAAGATSGTASDACAVRLLINSNGSISQTTNVAYGGYAISNGTNTVALIRESSTGDDGRLDLLNGGAESVLLIASGPSYIAGGNLSVGTTSNMGYALGVTGTLGVTGNSSLTGNLAVTGATTLTGSVQQVTSAAYGGYAISNGTNTVALLRESSSGDNGRVDLLNAGTEGAEIIASGPSYIAGGNLTVGTSTNMGYALGVTGTLGVSGGLTFGAHLISSGPAPSASAGTINTKASDTRGSVLLASGVTASTITFASAFSAAPFCVASASVAGAGAAVTSTSTTALGLSVATNSAGVTVTWQCIQ